MQASPQAHETRFATSRDGSKIAFDVTGSGPAVMLLHGGGQTRKAWHDAGYVERLAKEFTVIAVDLRGNGESAKPADSSAYSVEHISDDLLAVADAAGAKRFAVWGYSYGANVGRYLAVRSDRVRAMVYIGIPFGPAAQDEFREYIIATRTKWSPIIGAVRAGTLDAQSVSPEDRAVLARGTVGVSVAWMSAMLDYPSVEPRDMPCPTLWLVGTQNAGAMASVAKYKSAIPGTRITLEFLEGLTHVQELERIDLAFSPEASFTRAHQ